MVEFPETTMYYGDTKKEVKETYHYSDRDCAITTESVKIKNQWNDIIRFTQIMKKKNI
jgi:hypothetical protein